jgi:nucleoside phosphorylase
MPHKREAVIAAMTIEVAPLIGRATTRRVNGVDLFDLPNAVVAIGGVGGKFGRRAAEVAIQDAQPRRLISVGVAGALSADLKVGEVGRVREVIDVATGIRYPAADGGNWVLATSQQVSDVSRKRELQRQYGAHVVDMEGASVAQVAMEHGIDFLVLKSISDDAAFEMPPMDRFIENGRFAMGKFMMYIALHPRWWATLGKIKKNSELATKNLCRELKHLLESSGQ